MMQDKISGSHYSVRYLRSEDLQACIDLFNSYLGEGFINENELLKYISEPNRYAAGAFDDKSQLVSAITGIIINSQELVKYVPEDLAPKTLSLIQIENDSSIGILKSMATYTTHQRRGLGGKLVNDVTKWLNSNGVNKIVAFGWEDDKGCHIETTLMRAKYKKLARIENFWKQDSVKNNYSCPSCGTPCKCSVVIFIKELKTPTLQLY